MWPRRSAPVEPVLITSAAPSRQQEFDARKRQYAVVMAIRLICFLLAVIVPITWLRLVFIVAALVLPWVAVVAANQAKSRLPDGPRVFVPEPRRGLPEGEDPRPHPADRRS